MKKLHRRFVVIPAPVPYYHQGWVKMSAGDDV